MLKRIINTIIVLPLVVTLSLTTTGLTFFLHHCHCEGKLYVSINEKIHCHTSPSIQIEETHCCNIASGIHIDEETESCGCNDETITLKINEATPSINTIGTFSPCIVTVFASTHKPLIIDETKSIGHSHNDDELSPPLWGKIMLIHYCSLKIADIHS